MRQLSSTLIAESYLFLMLLADVLSSRHYGNTPRIIARLGDDLDAILNWDVKSTMNVDLTSSSELEWMSEIWPTLLSQIGLISALTLPMIVFMFFIYFEDRERPERDVEKDR